jgi:hypothetical protein
MECSSIRERLSAYLEDAVSREERVLIEEHLGSCKECSADLADLIKTIERIKGLEEVEPPAWMTQRIMAELREEAPPGKGILRRLFFPLYIKLPLQAVAALLVVGIALYVYRDIGPETRFAKAPSEESASHIPQRETFKEDKTGSSARSTLKKVPPEVTTVPEKPAQEPVPGKMEAGTDKMKAVPRAPEPPGPSPLMREERQKAPSPPLNEPATLAGALKKEAKGEANRAAPELETTSEGKIGSLVLTVKVRELESAAKDVEKIIVALGGKIVERQSHDGRRVFVIDLNTSKFDELIGKLKRIGDVGEKGLNPKGHEENMRVRIETVELKSVPHKPDHRIDY